MAHLLWQLCGHAVLEAAQDEGPQDLVQPVGHQQRLLLAQQRGLAAGVGQAWRAGKPLLEVIGAAEQLWHEEVEQAPQLRQVVLQRRA